MKKSRFTWYEWILIGFLVLFVSGCAGSYRRESTPPVEKGIERLASAHAPFKRTCRGGAIPYTRYELASKMPTLFRALTPRRWNNDTLWKLVELDLAGTEPAGNKKC